VGIKAAGVYLAFEGGPDASGPDGQGIGPYDEIVLRGARAVGERQGLGKVIALRSAAGSWRDAESSSSESDEGQSGRGYLVVNAGNGEVLVRFSDDDVAGHASVPDLGPFASVVVGTHEVRGDAETLAVRVSRISPWQLTDLAGSSFQGTTKEALVFVATLGSIATAPRQTPAASMRSPTRSEASATPAKDVPASPPDAADDALPSVWVDRVKAAPDIYISRPDRKR
jgi:hypothetical protein